MDCIALRHTHTTSSGATLTCQLLNHAELWACPDASQAAPDRLPVLGRRLWPWCSGTRTLLRRLQAAAVVIPPFLIRASGHSQSKLHQEIEIADTRRHRVRLRIARRSHLDALVKPVIIERLPCR